MHEKPEIYFETKLNALYAKCDSFFTNFKQTYMYMKCENENLSHLSCSDL